MEAINFRNSTIRYLVLAGDCPRENHEDCTIRLMIERERRRAGEYKRPDQLVVIATR